MVNMLTDCLTGVESFSFTTSCDDQSAASTYLECNLLSSRPRVSSVTLSQAVLTRQSSILHHLDLNFPLILIKRVDQQEASLSCPGKRHIRTPHEIERLSVRHLTRVILVRKERCRDQVTLDDLDM